MIALKKWASKYGIEEACARKWARKKRIPAEKIKGRWYIDESYVYTPVAPGYIPIEEWAEKNKLVLHTAIRYAREGKIPAKYGDFKKWYVDENYRRPGIFLKTWANKNKLTIRHAEVLARRGRIIAVKRGTQRWYVSPNTSRPPRKNGGGKYSNWRGKSEGTISRDEIEPFVIVGDIRSINEIIDSMGGEAKNKTAHFTGIVHEKGRRLRKIVFPKWVQLEGYPPSSCSFAYECDLDGQFIEWLKP